MRGWMPSSVLLATTLFLSAAPRANAALFTVDATFDAPDADAGDGACASAGGECTLRAAIEEANALKGKDVIQLPAGTYAIGLPGPPNLYGGLQILGDLLLLGAGASTTVIDGGGQLRVLQTWLNLTNPAMPRSRVTLQDVTIANGNGVAGPNSGIDGAAILNQADLTLERCVVRDNTGSSGSGILSLDTIDPVRHPRLRLRHTEVRNNTTQSSGAAVNLGGGMKAVIEDSVFSDNHADGPGGRGGAIIVGSKGRLVMVRCQLTGNTSNESGGAIANAGTTKIIDSVISGNSTAGSGGGIARIATEQNEVYGSPGPLRLIGDVITGNRANSDDVNQGFGGGVMSGTRGLSRKNTTITGNTGTGGAPDDCTCFF
jgi:CSLREA domain-containing protein